MDAVGIPAPAALLARYIEAKDRVRPHLMADIYTPDAVLTYSLATRSIRFPARVDGLSGITQTLVVDFATKYDRCKTYCVDESPPHTPERMAFVPWLVVMREHAVGHLRIGKGYYRWTVGTGGLVAAMHIHIERMDAIADPEASLLQAVQAALPYPWLPPEILGSALEALMQRDAAFAFLEDFTRPVDKERSHRAGARLGH